MSLSQSKAAALPVFHAISGCDCTESLAKKGKLSFRKTFANAPETTISALTNLGSAKTQSDKDMNELERFICKQQISPCYVRLTMCSRLHYPTGLMFMYQEPMCSTLRMCVSTVSLHRNVFMQWRRDML